MAYVRVGRSTPSPDDCVGKPTMPAWFVRARILVSLPFPFIVAFLFAWMI